MRRTPVLALLLLVLASACGTAPAEEAAPAVVGEWAGAIELPGAPLHVGVRLDGGEPLHGDIDIPAQRITDMPLGDVRVEGRELSFTLPEVGADAAFRGTVAADGSTINGTFTQNGAGFGLVLRPGAVQRPPQEPVPPFPYRSEDVTVAGDVPLSGTLTAPEGPGPFPAVLLLSGSGAQGRDSELFAHRPFLVVADSLTRAGFAVLRLDDRGVGGSGGTYADATLDDLTSDAVAALAFLRDRSGIDPERVGLFGHSEGGYIAPMAAQRTDVAFVVTAAGPAVDGGDVLVVQSELVGRASGLPPEQAQQQDAFIRELVRLLRAGQDDAARALSLEHLTAATASLPPQQRPSPQQLAAQNPVTRMYASFVRHDPTAALQALEVPVLALYGGKDLQVTPEQNEPVMRELLAGNPDATVRTVPDLNHVLQPATTGGLEEYATSETTIDPQVLDLVTGWLTERFPA